ncbi:MAG: hypothetical protein JKY62_16360 [Desulfocapsa sp.]|nr:hypothetical protein [Desulfocapsa sp.]
MNNSNRPVLSQSFFTGSGELIPETRTYKTKLPPFFSNLLPEGHLRTSIPTGGVGGDWIVKLPLKILPRFLKMNGLCYIWQKR